MEREWKIEIILETGILQELKNSLVNSLKTRFKNVVIKRKGNTPCLVINNLEINLFYCDIEVYTDSIEDLDIDGIKFILELCYKNNVIDNIKVGTKKIIADDPVAVEGKLGEMFSNHVIDETIFLSYQFAKVYDGEVALFNISLNTKGYQLQTEVLAEKTDDIMDRVKLLKDILTKDEVKKIISIGDNYESR